MTMSQHSNTLECDDKSCDGQAIQIYEKRIVTFSDKNKDLMAGLNIFERTALLERHAAGR
jgi:hypothetical protein